MFGPYVSSRVSNGSALRIGLPRESNHSSRAVIVQFDAVAVRVAQVHGDRRPVVLGSVYGVAVIQESLHGAA
jgi:hypothetical protein